MRQRQDGDLTRRPEPVSPFTSQAVVGIRTTLQPGLVRRLMELTAALYRSECQRTCPNAFPPELEIVYKILNIEEGSEAMLRIDASGNPFPDISWQHADNEVLLDDRVQLEQGKSLSRASH